MDPPPVGTVYTVYLCTSGGAACTDVSASYSTATYTGSTADFSGYPAATTLQFYVAIDAATTVVLNPAKYRSYYSFVRQLHILTCCARDAHEGSSNVSRAIGVCGV